MPGRQTGRHRIADAGVNCHPTIPSLDRLHRSVNAGQCGWLIANDELVDRVIDCGLLPAGLLRAHKLQQPAQ
jgi:hypothetical protein